MSPAPPERLGLLSTYKLVKGALQLLGAIAIGVVLVVHGPGTIEWLHGVATELAHHAAPHWCIRLANAVIGHATLHRAWIVALALLVDGALGVLEGWSLRRGASWGEWLVVVTTGLPLPFELYELWREPHVGRALALVINVVVVTVLLRRRLRASRPSA